MSKYIDNPGQHAGQCMIERALSEVISYDDRKVLEKQLRKLGKERGETKKERRRTSERKIAIKRRFEWDQSAREFFRSGEWEFWAALGGYDMELVMERYRKRL